MGAPSSAVIICIAFAASAQTPPLSLESIKTTRVKAEQVTYKGKQAIRVVDATQPGIEGTPNRIAVLVNTLFGDGTIEADLAGEPGPGASGDARGFVGIAFRIASGLSNFECFYLRPTNGRADDQIRRNHSLQYISFPDFPWQRLRKEFPEKYESYVDLVPGEWAKIRIEVHGEKARLFVNGVAQPNLIVNDLKLGAGRPGSVGLWIGPGTVAHFANLRVSSK